VVFRKELNRRSPLRIFERSLHGGLGKGNIGVVTSRKGVGKTAFLIGVALDDVMRDRQVLHVTLDHPVERIAGFYDEIFAELVRTTHLDDVAETRLAVERNRHILSYRGGGFDTGRIGNSMRFLAEHAAFKPDALIFDGYPEFETVTETEIAALKKLAQDFQVELWITAQRHREGQEKDRREIPLAVSRFDGYLSVIVRLESKADHVKLHLAKDHENKELSDLHMELDPKTLLLRWA